MTRGILALRLLGLMLIVYCPAKRMQLKEARMHVRWPGAQGNEPGGVEPLSTYQARVPRLADLDRRNRTPDDIRGEAAPRGFDFG